MTLTSRRQTSADSRVNTQLLVPMAMVTPRFTLLFFVFALECLRFNDLDNKCARHRRAHGTFRFRILFVVFWYYISSSYCQQMCSYNNNAFFLSHCRHYMQYLYNYYNQIANNIVVILTNIITIVTISNKIRHAFSYGNYQRVLS